MPVLASREAKTQQLLSVADLPMASIKVMRTGVYAGFPLEVILVPYLQQEKPSAQSAPALGVICLLHKKFVKHLFSRNLHGNVLMQTMPPNFMWSKG